MSAPSISDRSAPAALADLIDRALPQTQCTRCGYADCRAYATAIAEDGAAIDRCPPGGAEGIERLASITGRAPSPLDPNCGVEAPRQRAVIDEAWCIGCTLCLAVCPVDCIVGAAKRMHTVVADQCTGCELCLPVCPVDCIALVPASGERGGWDAWSAEQAAAAAGRYRQRLARLSAGARAASGSSEALPQQLATRQPSDLLAAALARSQRRQPLSGSE